MPQPAQHEHTIRVGRPFSLRATALGHGWHECAPFVWSEGGQCLEFITRRGTDLVRVSVVEQRRNARHVALRVTFSGDGTITDHADSLIREVETTLGLDRDLTGFYALCADHPMLNVLPDIGAGRLLRSASMTQNIIKTICGTNVNWAQAVKMINRIAQLGPFPQHFRNMNAWPSCREILQAGDDYLRTVARVGYRSEAILDLCSGQTTGTFDPDTLDTAARTEPTDDLRRRLLAIRGIGPASAAFLLSLMGHHDHLSIDSATIAHVAQIHTRGRKPTPARVRAIYAPYGRWQNLVYWFENWITWETAQEMINTESPRREP